MEHVEQLMKGGTYGGIGKKIRWVELNVSRRSSGLEISVKTDPRIEEFMKSLSLGATESLELYGKGWSPIPADGVLEVYSPINVVMAPNPTYTIGNLCESLSLGKGIINLSFLRIVGISSVAGVKFVVTGYPMSSDYSRTIGGEILKATRSLVKDYIVPINIDLRLSSVEF